MPESIVIVATPVGRHWQVTMPDGRSFTRTTLVTVRKQARKLLGDDFELQVSVRGLEDLCADSVELTEQSEAAFVRALRLRRIAARTLQDTGLSRADIGYLLGLDPGVATELLSVPVDSPWMSDSDRTAFRGQQKPAEPTPS